jgi:hypothetical protein
MNLVITTCSRPTAYLGQTLGSMYLADPKAHEFKLHFFIDGENRAAAKNFLHNGKPKFVVNADRDRGELQYPPNQRVTRNFAHALKSFPLDEELLIAEDDLLFRDEWVAEMRKCIDAAQSRSDRYVLSLYCPWELRGHPIVALDARAAPFYGNLMLYIPSTVRHELADYMVNRAVELPGDLLVRDWGWSTNTPIFASVPSLVQHAGHESSLGTKGGKSPMFPVIEP